MVSQKKRPLRVFGNGFGKLEHLDDGLPVFTPERQIHPRHQRKVKRHLYAFALAEVRQRVLGPLIGLGEQYLARPVTRLDRAAQTFDGVERLRQVFARRTFAFVKVWHGV